MATKKKQAEIEAIKYNGFNKKEIEDFIGFPLGEYSYDSSKICLTIPIFEGDIVIQQGDYIIKNANGEFCLCSSEAFESK